MRSESTRAVWFTDSDLKMFIDQKVDRQDKDVVQPKPNLLKLLLASLLQFEPASKRCLLPLSGRVSTWK